jgi:hypothetical protein
MEQINQGKLKILKGDHTVTVSKWDTNLNEWNEDLWSFIDGLIGKGYEIISINSHVRILFVILKKKN